MESEIVESIPLSVIKPLNTKRGKNNDLPLRNHLKKTKTCEEKLDLLFEIENVLPNEYSHLTEPARNFILTVMNPILKCFRAHHCSSLDGLKDKWGDFSHSNFRTKCCNGKETCC